MSNIKYVLLGKGTGYGEGIEGEGQVTNLASGGSFGYSADIANYLNGQPNVRAQGIFFVLDVPNIFKEEWNLVPNADSWTKAVIAMYETRPSGINGFQYKFTTEVGEYKMDATGANYWEVPLGVNISRSEPNFTWPADFIGRPIETILKFWTRIGLKDPYSRFAGVHTLRQNDQYPTRTSLADMWSLTGIFIQPDQSGKVCQEAYLIRNCWPKETPNNETTRGTDHIGLEEISTPHTGLVTVNSRTRQLGQLLLERSLMTGIADTDNTPITVDSDDKSLLPEKNLPTLRARNGEAGSYQASVDVTRQSPKEAPLNV